MGRLDLLIEQYNKLIDTMYDYLETMGLEPESDEHYIALVEQRDYYQEIRMFGY